MSEASKVLAEVRGWLCDNLDASDAGHVCGMLSAVSRRVVQADELESENAKLRTFIDLKETCWKYVGWCDECPYSGMDDEHDNCNCAAQEKINSLARELGIEVEG